MLRTRTRRHVRREDEARASVASRLFPSRSNVSGRPWGLYRKGNFPLPSVKSKACGHRWWYTPSGASLLLVPSVLVPFVPDGGAFAHRGENWVVQRPLMSQQFESCLCCSEGLPRICLWGIHSILSNAPHHLSGAFCLSESDHIFKVLLVQFLIFFQQVHFQLSIHLNFVFSIQILSGRFAYYRFFLIMVVTLPS